jgi:hypothetical protein
MKQAAGLQLDGMDDKGDTFRLFDLGSFLPGRQLLVNVSMSVVSLLAQEQELETLVLAQRVLNETQMRILLALLAFPTSCPQEVLLASYHCAYEVLLRFFLSPDTTIVTTWNTQVQEYRKLLSEAKERGTLRKEMRGVYNALFSSRQKLEELGITVRPRKDGYYLASLKEK